MPFKRFFRIPLSALFFIAGVVCSQAQAHTVALTFDDLPVVGENDPAQAQSITSTILSALDRRHAPAIGFVIGQRVEELGKEQGKHLLEQWIRHGHPLGNHTFSHPDLNKLTAEQFGQDVIEGEKILSRVQAKNGDNSRYLRFPYNHTGNTQAKHDAVAAFLANRGYRVATCTIDNEDFLFNRAYLQMLARKDDASGERLRAEYLAYTSTEIDYYSSLHKQVFGREIPQVMLLHVNRLNADVIDELLAIFEQKQYRFVTLDTAQSDPAYATPDTLAIEGGMMWGYRWAKEHGVKVDGSLETEPAAWISQYRREPAKP
jgi:peptidoglycan/xylan/chitin deacetylase (PgdA/CDA1 family)